MFETLAGQGRGATLEASSAFNPKRLLTILSPAIFVLLWSTGFIGAKYGLPYADPFTFLAIRMWIAGGLLAIFTLARGASFPKNRRVVGEIALAGLLMHALYLGGVYFAIKHGMPSGLSSLIIGLQPVITAILAQPLVNERVSPRQWGGLALGIVGVGLVVAEKVNESLSAPIEHRAFVAITIGLLGTTFGTLYQKRFKRENDLGASAAVQYGASAVGLTIAAFAFEPRHVQWTWRFGFAIGWLVIVLSFGAFLLLLQLIRESSVSRVSSLLYLVPGATAIEAYFMFDEKLGLPALIGMVIAAIGVAIVVRQPQATT